MTANRWKRFADWDERPLRLDRFAREDPAKGFSAMKSPADPAPSVAVEGGRIAAMDGVAAADFDMIDRFIASYHLDPQVAPEAMAIPSLELARMLVDMTVPRTDLVRLAHGLTPARLAEVVGHLSALEIAFAYSKMRARRTPGNQGHVTNAKDDPLQLAADAAIAVGLGFDEIETTQRVARNAWSNALACAVGAAVGRWGTLFQCASEEAEELQIAMARLHLLRRDRLGLRLRGRLRRRRRHPLVQGLPRRRLRLARRQDARHLRRRLRAADGLPPVAVAALPRGALPLPATRHRRAGHPERRHRRRPGHHVDRGRRPRADGREPDRGLARPRMRLRQRRPPDRIRDPRRRQDHALPRRRLRPDLLRHGHDPQVRQLLQPLAPERRGARGLPRPPARLRGRRRPDPDRRGQGDGAPHPRPRRRRRRPRRARPRPPDPGDARQRRHRLRLERHGKLHPGRRLPHQRGDPHPRHHGHRRRSAPSPPAASAKRPRTCSRSSACGSPATTCRPRR